MSLLRIVLLLSVAFGVAFSTYCPSSWTAHGHFCYRLFSTPQTWDDAENCCQQFTSLSRHKAHLVSILNDSENKFVKKLLETTYGTNGGPYWIGLKEFSCVGRYKWSDDSRYSYQDWLPSEPNNHSKKKRQCVRIDTKHGKVGWGDKPCDKKYKLVCKMRKY